MKNEIHEALRRKRELLKTVRFKVFVVAWFHDTTSTVEIVFVFYVHGVPKNGELSEDFYIVFVPCGIISLTKF